MIRIGPWRPRLSIIILLIAGLVLVAVPAPALSQQNNPADIQNLIVNGGFEQGFQGEFGVGYGWGGFSNGSAVVGWHPETWSAVVVAGTYGQAIEIKNATERDRFAGIYQTVRVVPGQQYKLTIKGLIRSEEGDIEASDYGYRLQYTVDLQGGTAWELVDPAGWREIPWDEQPMSAPSGSAYRLETFETTLTAKSEQLTLFIRGWKKWLNNGTGIYNLDEISLVGPAPVDFAGAVAPIAADKAAPNSPELLLQVSEHASDMPTAQPPEATPELGTLSGAGTTPEAGSTPQISAPPAAATTAPAQNEAAPPTAAPPPATSSALPVSGYGRDDSFSYTLIAGLILLLVLGGSAFTATIRRRTPGD